MFSCFVVFKIRSQDGNKVYTVNQNTKYNGHEDHHNGGGHEDHYNGGGHEDHYNGGDHEDHYNGGGHEDHYNGGDPEDHFNGGGHVDHYNGGGPQHQHEDFLPDNIDPNFHRPESIDPEFDSKFTLFRYYAFQICVPTYFLPVLPLYIVIRDNKRCELLFTIIGLVNKFEEEKKFLIFLFIGPTYFWWNVGDLFTCFFFTNSSLFAAFCNLQVKIYKIKLLL